MKGEAVQISVSIPASLADADVAERARMLLVLDGVRSERMSWRAAARTLGLSPDAFLDLARQHGVPVHRVEADDLRADLATLAKLERLRDARS